MPSFNQEASIRKVQDNITRIINGKFPFEHKGYTFEVSDLTFNQTDTSPEAQDDAFTYETTLESQVRGTIRVLKDGQLVREHKNAVISWYPNVTERGTYILSGNEKTFLNQMNLRPGVYIHPTTSKADGEITKAEVRAGSKRFVINFNAKTLKLQIEGLDMEYGAKGKVDAISFLKVLGITDEELEKAIGKTEYNAIKTKNTPQTLKAIYSQTHTSAFPGNDEAREQIQNFMAARTTLDDKAKKVAQQMIGASADYVDKGIMLSTISQLFKEYKKPGSTPNVDDIRFKEISSSEDIITRGVEKGVDAWIKRIKDGIKNNNGELNDNYNIRPVEAITKEVRKMYNSDLAEPVDSPNPLDLHQKKSKLTMLGEGGLTDRATKNENRNLQDTAFAKIDPVETPQSVRMGLIQHLAQGAEIKDGKIYSKFYRVNNGVIDKSKVVNDIDPLDEYDEYIAFNIPKDIEKKDGTSSLLPDKVRVRHKGDFIEVPKSKVTLIDFKPNAHLSDATSLIPFGAHNDGARMLMGSSMQRQSLSLEDPDEPLVQSISDEETGRTMEEEVAENASFLLKAPVSGKITDIKENYIEIEEEDGSKNRVKKLNYFSTGKMGGYINHKPVVKVGDTVEAGDLLADGWQSKNGKLALGKNTLIAYMPFEGYNFEDGVVVSESFAKKMASEEIKTIEIEVLGENNVVGTPDVKKILKDLGVSPGVLNKLDSDGVIKKGEEVSAGDIFVGAYRQRKKDEFSEEVVALKRITGSKLFELPEDLYSNTSRNVQGYQKGKIIDVKKIKEESTGSIKVIIKMLSFKPMEVGDKLSGRHGNKGTITKILPDAEMPHTEDNEAVELIFSPLAVPSRKNVGQLLEVNAGLVAKKKGLDAYRVQNFDNRERERLMKDLEDIGVPDGKMKLINPATGKPYENPVTVGPMYIMKLKHKVESKLTARNIGAVDPVLGMPKKLSGSIDGERTNPQSVGGMEFWSLTSAGAVHNIHEMTTLKSDGAGDKRARMDIFDAIRKGEKIPEPVTPQTLKVLSDKVKAAGLQITPIKDDKRVTFDEQFTSLMLQPLSKEFKEFMKNNETSEVLTPKTRDALTNSVDKKGLYSETVFGKNKDQWGKITLQDPMPNPLFMRGNNPYEAMLSSRGFTNKKINSIIKEGQMVVFDPGDSDLGKYQIIDLKNPEIREKYGMDIAIGDIKVDTGGSALHALLKDVDLKEELKLAEERLRTATKVPDRSKAQKQVRVLASALDNKFEPTDFMLDFIPVLPVKYREGTKTAQNDAVDDGITRLYQRFMQTNDRYKRALEQSGKENIDPETYVDFQKEAYANLEYIFGTTNKPYKDPKTGQEFKGILHDLSQKSGFFRDKMQSKKQDYSGRSVIVVDPVLDLDQVSLPEDMAAEIYKPHIMRELEKENYKPQEITTFMNDRTKEFRKALLKVTEDNPVILNRQPSLHRHSLQAFYPKVRWNDGQTNRAIGLNPMVTTGFNADFDGDTMSVHVPITDAAKREAKEKLMPSKNLYNPTNGSLIMELKHEMQLGIFYMTKNRMPIGTPKEFKKPEDLIKAYEKGEVSTYDAVRMEVQGKGMVISTAGKHIFNSCLPPKFRDFTDDGPNSDVNKGKMTRIINSIIEDKQFGPMFAVQSMNKLQKIGFKSATMSGVSIGVKDFAPVASLDKAKLFEDAEKKLNVANFIDKRDEFEQEKVKLVENAIKDQINNNLFDSDNPVEIMRRSGARGNAGQIANMGAMVGRGADVTGKATRPVTSSLLEGLTPDEFWNMSYDSRKGIYDRSVATRDPGHLSRGVWMANKQTVITEKDCGTLKGITLNIKDDKDKSKLRGRILLKDVPLKDGTVVRATKQPISAKESDKIISNAINIHNIEVRSPAVCESTQGVCQMCYGAAPGTMTNELVSIGEPVGSIAAQAIGEPSQQAIMKTFHTGAGGSNISGAFERINQVLRMPNMQGKTETTVLAEKDGVVTNIINEPLRGTTIVVDKKKYFIGKKPKAAELNIGSPVKAGDPLNEEIVDGTQISFRDPKQIMEIQGPEAAQNYLLQSVNEAFVMGGIDDTDQRHTEVAISNMMNRAVVTSPGSANMREGQPVPLKAIKAYNQLAGKPISASLDYANRTNVIGSQAAVDVHDKFDPKKVIVKKGETITEEKWNIIKDQRRHMKIIARPVAFEQKLVGIGSDPAVSNNNWMEAAGYENVKNSLSVGASTFMKDNLDNPLTRQMTGLKGNFSDGFQKWKNEVNNKYSDFF